jgi:hypothetical protein
MVVRGQYCNVHPYQQAGGRNPGYDSRQEDVTLDIGHCMARMMVMKRKIHSKQQAGGSNPGQERTAPLSQSSPGTSGYLAELRMSYSRLWMRSGRMWIRSSRMWMRSGRMWMRSSRMWMRSGRMRMTFGIMWMRSSRMWMEFGLMWMRASRMLLRSSRGVRKTIQKITHQFSDYDYDSLFSWILVK